MRRRRRYIGMGGLGDLPTNYVPGTIIEVGNTHPPGTAYPLYRFKDDPPGWRRNPYNGAIYHSEDEANGAAGWHSVTEYERPSAGAPLITVNPSTVPSVPLTMPYFPSTAPTPAPASTFVPKISDPSTYDPEDNAPVTVTASAGIGGNGKLLAIGGAGLLLVLMMFGGGSSSSGRKRS